jgi:predicted kinase
VKLHILCGIPGSGKSTLGSRLQGYVVSTDNLRKFLWNDEAVVQHDKLVFALAKEIIAYLLSIGKNVIFDATNLTAVKRRSFIKLGQKYQAQIILHWVNTPLQTALVRNSERERKVPTYVIKSLYKSFQRPRIEEGIHVIKLYNEDLKLAKVITAQRIFKR